MARVNDCQELADISDDPFSSVRFSCSKYSDVTRKTKNGRISMTILKIGIVGAVYCSTLLRQTSESPFTCRRENNFYACHLFLTSPCCPTQRFRKSLTLFAYFTFDFRNSKPKVNIGLSSKTVNRTI